MQDSSNSNDNVHNNGPSSSSATASTTATESNNNNSNMTTGQARQTAARTAQVASTMVQQAHKLFSHCRQSHQSTQTWRQKLVSVVIELRKQSLSVSHLENDLRQRSAEYTTRLNELTGLSATAAEPLHEIFGQLQQVPADDWIKGASSSQDEIDATGNAKKMSLYDYVDAEAVLSLEQQASMCETEMDAIVSSSAMSASEIGSRLLRLFSMTRTIFATSGTADEASVVDEDGAGSDEDAASQSMGSQVRGESVSGSFTSSASLGQGAANATMSNEDVAAHATDSSKDDEDSDKKNGQGKDQRQSDVIDEGNDVDARKAAGEQQLEEGENDSVHSRVVRLSVTSVSESLAGLQHIQLGDTTTVSGTSDQLRTHPFQEAERAMETWETESRDALAKLVEEVEFMTRLETGLLDVVRAIDTDSESLTDATKRLQDILRRPETRLSDLATVDDVDGTDNLVELASLLDDANAKLVAGLRGVAALTQLVGRSAKAMQNAKQTLQVSLLPSLDNLAATAGERVAHADDMHVKFIELERQLPLLADEMNNLAAFYAQFVSAHGQIEAELFRRWNALARMEETAREQQQVLAQMYNKEFEERDQFFQQHGQFLPQTLCRALGAHLQPTTFQYFPVNPEDATLLYESVSRKQLLDGVSASQLELPPSLALPSGVGVGGGEESNSVLGGSGFGNRSNEHSQSNGFIGNSQSDGSTTGGGSSGNGSAFQLPPPARDSH